MKVDITKKNDVEKVITIEVEPERYQGKLDKLVREVARNVQIPGFRKGKAPRQAIINRVGADALKHDLLEELIPEVVNEVLVEKEIMPLDTPQLQSLHEIEFVEGEPIEFEVIVQVTPEFELEGYKDLELIEVKKDLNVDEFVEKQVENLRRQHATMVPVEEDRTLEEGDTAHVDFVSYFEDGTEVPGGQSMDYYMDLEEEQFIPGFMDKMLGHKKDEEFEFDIVFPDSYPKEDMAGKNIHFKVNLKGIMKKEMPERDAEFAKTVGAYESYEGLEEDIRNRIEENIKQQKRGMLEDQVSKKLAMLIPGVMVPPAMVARHLERFKNNLEQQFSQMGVKLEDHLKEMGKSENEFLKGFYPQARENAKSELVISKIIELENIEVSDEELDEEIARFAKQYKQDPKVFKQFLQSQNQLDSIAEQVLMKKVFDLVIENAEILEKTEEELQAEIDSKTAESALKAASEEEKADVEETDEKNEETAEKNEE